MPIQRKHDFKAGTKISSDQVDEEFNQLVSQVNQVEAELLSKESNILTKAQMTKITTDNGGVVISLSEPTDDLLQRVMSKGTGLHSFYAATGVKNTPSGIATRGMAQMTAANFGWIWCLDFKNQMWTNYLNNNTWSGWKEVSSIEQSELWSGNMYLQASQNVTPSKPLSDCRNGWILVWSDYDPAPDDKVNNYDFVFSYVPKGFADKHAGAWCYFTIPTFSTETRHDIVTKRVRVYNNRLEGNDVNSSRDNGARDAVLRYVLEI